MTSSATPVVQVGVATSPASHPAAPYVVAGAALLATAALRLRDPHVSGSWGLCPLRFLTGFDCPFCGGLRAVNDLTHGDVGAASASNVFFLASIPLLVVMWVWWARGGPSTRTMRVALAAWGVVGIAFTVYRNTPWGHAFWA